MAASAIFGQPRAQSQDPSLDCMQMRFLFVGPAPHGPQNNVEIKRKTISTKPTTVTETASG